MYIRGVFVVGKRSSWARDCLLSRVRAMARGQLPRRQFRGRALREKARADRARSRSGNATKGRARAACACCFSCLLWEVMA